MLAVWQLSCSKDKPEPVPEPEPIKLDRDSVSSLLARRSFYITDAWRLAGNDSVDMFKEDTLLRLYANAAALNFYIEKGSGEIMFHGGASQFPNTEMPGNALTFNLNIRIFLPTQMKLKWDDDKGTLGVETVATTSYFPMIVPGKKGYLDPASFNVKMSMEQAKTAAVKPSMRFIYEDEDPKLGKVTYKITMKPMYQYYREPGQQASAKYVVFL
ncbi:hypothetical protein SAMN04487996_12572 [Dyadobacter soli]|uniref:Uncharacterized protein n=2 Tax=Dyadobacter soli TaxID=659014 RepID=A0A1G7Y6U8_9BACT|nr:hypothetical protein SAMN04487996_12572 [Dyadobacter soli]